MTLVVRDLTEYSIPPFEALLADDDLECRRQGLLPYEAILRATQQSVNSWVLEADGQAVLFGGYIPRAPLSPVCQVWFLGTPLCEKYKMTVFRTTLAAMKMLFQRFSHITVMVDPTHERGIRLVKRLGFHKAAPEFQGLEMWAVSKEDVPWVL